MRDNCSKCQKIEGEDMSDNQLELVSMISEFNSIHEYMADDELDRCLELVVKLIVRHGEVDYARIPHLIVELQALATKFAILASYYGNMGRGGSAETHKKNMYYTLKEAISKLVDSLKYMAKA